MFRAAAYNARDVLNSKRTTDHARAQQAPDTQCQFATSELRDHLNECSMQAK